MCAWQLRRGDSHADVRQITDFGDVGVRITEFPDQRISRPTFHFNLGFLEVILFISYLWRSWHLYTKMLRCLTITLPKVVEISCQSKKDTRKAWPAYNQATISTVGLLASWNSMIRIVMVPLRVDVKLNTDAVTFFHHYVTRRRNLHVYLPSRGKLCVHNNRWCSWHQSLKFWAVTSDRIVITTGIACIIALPGLPLWLSAMENGLLVWV